MKNALEYLEKQNHLSPRKTAVDDGETALTYEELYRLTLIGGSFIGRRVARRAAVGVFMEKSSYTLSVFLAAVCGGAFYCLINPQFPQERIKSIADVLKPQMVVCESEDLPRAKELFGGNVVVSREELFSAAADEEDKALIREIRSQATDSDPLYVNFTSGSTGVPKGVIISHRSVIDFIENFTEVFPIASSDIIANQAPFDFDVSVKDIYSSLKTGATLLLVPREYFSQPVRLIDYLCAKKATVLIWAVSALCLVTTFHALDYMTPDSVRMVLFSGEVMPEKHLSEWISKLPQALFANLYGPTEITCNCTYHIVDKERDYGKRGLPIGKAFDNEKVFLLDSDNRQIFSPFTEGEICVGGSCLSLGYLNNPEQTEKAFVLNPLESRFRETIYRTGDIAFYNEEGELFFCGRKDFQIKYQGHRIELEEIERAIEKTEGVSRCIAIFDEEKSKLYGFFVGDIDRKTLHLALKEKLPLYMIPSALRQVEKIPLTKNGKADRKALLQSVKGKRK